MGAVNMSNQCSLHGLHNCHREFLGVVWIGLVEQEAVRDQLTKVGKGNKASLRTLAEMHPTLCTSFSGLVLKEQLRHMKEADGRGRHRGVIYLDLTG
ncbi:hypothetical protein SKAU_G00338920 [Synaphobranchus kaupii]|uniref:Uncharacterized protein n=1 Tax=Synaphobranchus kaupii TaxID=118154 RepID=A0A9Q1EMQ2_SYNKA|nr:hypothetical protein SKAU_G00338920 [Synaphobranchus kaupii]